MAAVALIALSGCSLGGDEERLRSEPASRRPRRVAATVRALDEAIKRRD